MAHVAKWKRERVQALVDLMVNSHVVGIVDLHGIPAAQMISMRAVLRGKADVNMTRNTLMDLAITEAAVGAGITSVLFFVTLKKIHAIKGDSGREQAEK